MSTPAAGGVPLCTLRELADGASRGFDPLQSGQDTMFLVRRAGVVHAWQNRCPHDGVSPMAWRKDAYLNADGSRIVCYAHGAQFDVATGMCHLGPCFGQSLVPAGIRILDDVIHYIGAGSGA